jgi:Domain of unknown function (DUF4266)
MHHRDQTMRGALRVIAAAACLGAATLASGCASIGPKPWQKDLMAKPEMQVDAYALVAAADDHIYFSKEAASGGRGFAGGGCGCN